MQEYRVLIVDDSPFSRSVIQRSLGQGYSVCGTAATGYEAIDLYFSLRPDVTIMDIAMPEMDGVAAAKAILARDNAAKIIMLSAMKDASLVNEARESGVRWFLQKPLKASDLSQALANVLGQSSEFASIAATGVANFRSALEEIIGEWVGGECRISAPTLYQRGKVTHTVVAVVGIAGKYQGTFVLSCRKEVASGLLTPILAKPEISEQEIFNWMAELANIIAGQAISKTNALYLDAGFRLTPPGLFSGAVMELNPQIAELQQMTVATTAGELNVCIGFANPGGGK